MSQAVVSQIVPSEVTLSPSACREKQLFLILYLMNPFAVTNNCPLSLFTMFGAGFKKNVISFFFYYFNAIQQRDIWKTVRKEKAL